MCMACEMGFWVAVDEPPDQPPPGFPRVKPRTDPRADGGFACDAPAADTPDEPSEKDKRAP